MSTKVREQRWGVILAGGDGTRLRSVTKLIAGDDRPKQFCKLLGDKTILAETRLRVSRMISDDRIMLALTKAHEPFYAAELAEVPPIQMVVQPANKGTLPAILWSLMRLVRLNRRALGGFFPSDHYYRDEVKFVAEVDRAFRAAASSQSVILLAAEATEAEPDYGWIEPQTGEDELHKLLGVRSFWEKPTPQMARTLLDQGCLWNTFVMVGHARRFLELIRSAEPTLYEAFELVVERCRADANPKLMEAIYDEIAPADFATWILSRCTDKLSIMRMADVGWNDLGDAHRFIETLCALTLRKPPTHSGPSSLSSAATTR